MVTVHRIFAGIIVQLSEMYLVAGCYRYKAEGGQAYFLFFTCLTGK